MGPGWLDVPSMKMIKFLEFAEALLQVEHGRRGIEPDICAGIRTGGSVGLSRGKGILKCVCSVLPTVSQRGIYMHVAG